MVQPIMREEQSRDYYLVEKAISYQQQNLQLQPALSEIASHLRTSPSQLQHLFKRWAGSTPGSFLQYLIPEHLVSILEESGKLLETAPRGEPASAQPPHILPVTFEAAPGKEQASGSAAEVRVDYGFHFTPFGRCLLAVTPKGICALWFFPAGREQKALEALQASRPMALLKSNEPLTSRLVEDIFTFGGPGPRESNPLLRLHLRGTPFQNSVWKALLDIPPGYLLSYGNLASRLGKPRACRAVARAAAQNQVSYLVPCHRLLRNNGIMGGYRWGATRKAAMLGWEAAARR